MYAVQKKPKKNLGLIFFYLGAKDWDWDWDDVPIQVSEVTKVAVCKY